MAKKVFLQIINILSVVIIALALFVLLSVVLTRRGDTPNVLGFSAFRVVSGSMRPELQEDDLIVIKRVAPDKIAVGDIISFYSPDPELRGAVNTHRVTAVAEEGGQYVFTTKGDANMIEDKYGVRGDEVLGKVVLVSVLLGKLSRLAANPLVFVPLILVPLLAILLTNLVRTVRLAKEAAQEEERRELAALAERMKKQRESGEQKAE